MNRSKYFVSLALIALLFWGGYANSSILVIAPHPDDDLLIAAGVTYAATQRGEQVTIVYMTNGDIGGPGNLRQDEAVAGQINYLGTRESDLIFLGYPDAGLETMYRYYSFQSDRFLAPSGRTATYAHRGLGGTDYHNYRFGTHANYNGYNILNDLKDIINTLRPDHIITVAEFDRHWDHYTTYYITRDAILAITAADPSYVPVLNKSVVHAGNTWPNPIDPLSYFSEPPGLSGTGFAFANRESLDVPLVMQVEDLTNLKYNAIATHISQGGVDDFLGKFIHKDEFFWPVNLNGSNIPPRVNAGVDQTVNQGSLVILNGSASNDPNGTVLAYQWRQTTGLPVILSNATTVTPSFTAPSGLTTDIKLAFELIVDDGILNTLPDHVSVRVLPLTGGNNTAPTFVGGPTTLTVTQNSSALDLKPNLHVSDTDVGQTETWSQSVAPAHGTLIISGATASSGSTNITPGGTITYQPAAGYKGTDSFSVRVSDGIATATRSFAVNVTPTTGLGSNIASLASVSASSQNTSTSQQAIKAVDGIVDGMGTATSDYTREWATINGRAGSWLELNWAASYQVNQVVLYDRPNTDDQITSATLTFSNGSTVTVGALNNTGAGVVSNFTPVTTNRIRVTATTVSGTTINVGLSEIEVYGVPSTGGNNTAPTFVGGTTTLTVAQNSSALDLKPNLQVSDIDTGQTETWSQSAAPAHGTLTFSGATASSGSTNITPGGTITYQPAAGYSGTDSFAIQVSDGIATATRSFAVNVTPTTGLGSNIASLASVTASSQNTSTSQQAIKAVDGIVDGVGGVPGDYTREWATVNGLAGSWLELNWATSYQVNQVVLYDRPNTDDQITSATLTFSNGSTVTVAALNNTGAGVVSNFTPVTTNRVRVTATTVSGTTINVGLSEIEVYGVPSTSGNNTAPTFVGGTTSLTVARNSSAVSLKTNLHVSDIDTGQTETWSQNVSSAHGTLTFSGATASSGSTNITPGGTITYRPASGYSGSDTFKVQVSDGVDTAIRTFVVTIR